MIEKKNQIAGDEQAVDRRRGLALAARPLEDVRRLARALGGEGAGRLRREVEIGNAREQQALAAWESTVFSALEETADALAALDGSQREQERHGVKGDGWTHDVQDRKSVV